MKNCLYFRKNSAISRRYESEFEWFQIDHLALRANSEEKAKNWLTELLKCGRILSDNIVNGRPIYLIELDEPVDFIGQPVDVIELPFPKINNIPKKLGNILKL